MHACDCTVFRNKKAEGDFKAKAFMDENYADSYVITSPRTRLLEGFSITIFFREAHML
jgi:hypothetical protein